MMKKFKFLFIALTTFLLVGVVKVTAEQYEGVYGTLTSDGTITVPYMNNNPRDWHLDDYLATFNTDNYQFQKTTCNEDFTMCSIMGIDYLNDTEETHDITINYKEVYSDEFKALTDNGKLTIESMNVNNPGDWLFNYIQSFSTDEYQFQLNDCKEDFSVCTVMGINGITDEVHDIKMTYKEIYSDMFKEIAPNNQLTVPVMNLDRGRFIIENYLSTLNTNEYTFQLGNYNEDYSEATINVLQFGTVIEQHDVFVKFKETYSEDFKSILTDGNLIVKESDLDEIKSNLINRYINKFASNGVSYSAGDCNEDYSICTINRNDMYGNFEQHKVNIKYKDEYSEDFKKFIKDRKIVVTSSTVDDRSNLVWGHINGLRTEKFDFSATCNEGATKCSIAMTNKETGKTETHVVDIIYEEKISKLFDNIITDGKVVVKSVQPKNEVEAQFYLQSYLSSFSNATYEYSKGMCNEDFTVCDVSVYYLNQAGNSNSETHKVKVTYEEIDTNKAAQVNKVLSSIPKNKTFVVDDLELINFIVNGGYTNDALSASTESSYINYSSELKQLLGNGNITAQLEVGAGDPRMFSHENLGGYVVSYDGVAYGLFEGGAVRNYVIYVPDNTEESMEAYLKAAQERINSYLGHSKAKLTYGGELSEFDEFEYENIEHNGKLRNEYYVLTYNDCMIPFLIIKDSSKMKEISNQTTNDVITNISISMTSSTLPLDTSIMVDEISKDSKKYSEITNALIDNNYGVNNALVYDLKLYSSSNKDYIIKLKDGSFEVKIPISKDLEGKTLIVYYVDENGKVDEHEVTPKDGYAVFTTNHFSIYTLTEKNTTGFGVGTPNIETPNTFDGVSTYFVLAFISLIGFTFVGLYLKKLNVKKDY